MPRDIYMRDITDPNFRSGILEISDEVEMLISQIKMMLRTNKGEILGAPDFGADIEQMLFTFNANEFTIRNTLNDQVMKFIPLADQYQVDFDVKFSKGVTQDICLIDVKINNVPAFGVLVQ